MRIYALRHIWVTRTKCAVTETWWLNPPKHHNVPTQGDCLKRNIKAILNSNETPSHSSSISPCIRSVHSISSGKHHFTAPAEVWAQTSHVNLLDRNYFHSNLPSTNDLTCQYPMLILRKITCGRWIVTAAWARQVLGGKTWEPDQPVKQTCLDTTSVGDRTVFHCILKLRQVNSSKNYIMAKFTSMLDSR